MNLRLDWVTGFTNSIVPFGEPVPLCPLEIILPTMNVGNSLKQEMDVLNRDYVDVRNILRHCIMMVSVDSTFLNKAA